MKKIRPGFIVLGALVLANALFVPFASLMQGLFPEDYSINFFKLIEFITDGDNPFENPIVWIGLSIVVPSVILFVISFSGSKGGFLGCSLFGVVAMVAATIYALKDVESEAFEYLFDVDFGLFAIGMWIAIILFIVSVIVAIAAKDRPIVQTTPAGNAYVNPQPNYAPVQPQAPAMPCQPQAPVEPEAQVEEANAEDVVDHISATQEIDLGESAAEETLEAPMEDVTSNAEIICANCGKSLKSGAKFCSGCGTKVN